MTATRGRSGRRRVGIIPWGDVIEDYLDPIGLDLDQFADDLDEGWLFGYVDALKAAGIEAVIVFATSSSGIRAWTHGPTGAPMIALPRTVVSRSIRRYLGDRNGRGWVGWAPRRICTAVATATSMPLGPLGEVVEEYGLDSLIVQEYENPRFDVLVRWGRRRGLPVLASFQGGDRSFAPGEQRLRRATMKQAAHLLIPARAEILRVRLAYGDSAPAITNVPNPVNVRTWPHRDPADARRQLGLDPSETIFVCHGRIDVRRKGLDILVDAWKQSSASRSGARLVLIGAGDGDDELERMLTLAPASIDWKRGFVTDRRVIREWLAAADVYVSASRVEGMAVAPIEAMTASLPVILSDIPGAAELAGREEETGVILTSVGDVRALAAAIDRVAADPELRRALGSAARVAVASRCSTEAVGEQLREALVSAV